MPRFTIGSLMSGLVLAGAAVLGLRFAADRGLVKGPRVVVPPAPGALEPMAVDPARGTVALGVEKANDFALQDAFDTSGGLDAATW